MKIAAEILNVGAWALIIYALTRWNVTVAILVSGLLLLAVASALKKD